VERNAGGAGVSRIPKAISIRAPWWWFILHAGKDIENRDWPTSFRGTVYIHASKWYSHVRVISEAWDMCQHIPGLRSLMLQVTGGAHPYSYLKAHGGCIVGKVDIAGCVATSASPWFFGEYGFVLANPVAFARPIPCKGALGFFTVPDEVLAQLNNEVRP
jgi:hypothetical protein